MKQKKAIIYGCSSSNPGLEHRNYWATAFRDGLRKHGWNADITDTITSCDLLCMWGARRQELIQNVKKQNIPICIVERGFIDRFNYSMVGFNGNINNRADYYGVSEDDSRLNTLFPGLVKPWKSLKNRKALLIGQVYGDASIKHITDASQWYINTAKELREKGWLVSFRPHPQNRAAYPKLDHVEMSVGPLEEVLSSHSLVVTINSNVSVDAILAGIPTITTDPGSMAWEVTQHTIPYAIEFDPELYCHPNRQLWAAKLVWKQFSKLEMESGYCWDIIGNSF